MASSTVPTTGVKGYTPEEFKESGQKAVVSGDTLIIAAVSKSSAKNITPITDLATYNLRKIGESSVQMTGDLAKTYAGGLAFKGSSKSETLTFGADTRVNGKKVETKVRNTKIDLSGGGSDQLSIIGKTSVKKTTVIIDAKDTITNKKGQTFTSEDVNKNGKIKGLGGITFDVV